MSDVAAAPAAMPGEAPIQSEAPAPTPLSNDTPPAPETKPETAKEVPTTRDALRAAAARVEAREAKIAAEEKAPPAEKTLPPADSSKTAAKDQKPESQVKPETAPVSSLAPAEQPAPAATRRTVAAPERFSNDAKAVWDTAPEPVKAEVDRLHREMKAGIEKYRQSAERDSKVARYHDMAHQSGTTLDAALERYTQMETLLRQNPLKGLEAVANNVGLSLRQVAEVVMGQTPDQERASADATVRELRQTIAQLAQQVGGVTRTFEDQRNTELQQRIESFAAERPLFDVLAPHIAAEIGAGAATLDEAEERVFQKFPQLAAIAKASAKPAAIKPDPAASSAAATDLSAQTEKGSKSIAGAPGGGSEPPKGKPSSSIKEALKRAAARAG